MKAIDYAAPKTLAQAVTLLAKHGDKARILAGGTDILVQLREGRRDADVIVDVKHVKQLNELTCNPRSQTPELRIGAAVPCYRIYEHKNVRKRQKKEVGFFTYLWRATPSCKGDNNA